MTREQVEAAVVAADSLGALNELVGRVIDLGAPATAEVARLVNRRRHELIAEAKRAERNLDTSGGSV